MHTRLHKLRQRDFNSKKTDMSKRAFNEGDQIWRLSSVCIFKVLAVSRYRNPTTKS